MSDAPAVVHGAAAPAAAAGRRVRSQRRPRSRRFRAVLLLAAASLCALLTLLLVAYETAPDGADLARRVDARLAATGARPVALSQIAPALPAAVLDTEDERFYADPGVDVLAILRDLPHDALHPGSPQGASTITEQLAKLLYLNGDDRSPWRKLEDAMIALRLEDHATKQQILADYLDTAYFGRGAYGIRAASRRFFGVAPAHLTLAQASLLAGLLQAPGAYDPVAHPRAARERQTVVLRALVRDGDVPARRARAVLHEPLRIAGARVLEPLPHAALGTPAPPHRAPVVPALALAAAVILAGTARVAIRRRRVARGG